MKTINMSMLKGLGAGVIPLAAMLALCPQTANAVPAYPGLITVDQADGTCISIQRVGDEFGHIVLTEDGFPLLFNAATRNYEYAVMKGSRLESTGITATAAELRDSKTRNILESVDRQEVMAQFDRDWAEGRRAALYAGSSLKTGMNRIVKISDVPTIGRHDVLVILVDFADKKFSDNEPTGDPVEYYDRFFHQEGFSDYGARGSAHDYYYEGSCGLYDPQFRVLGPVVVSDSYADYGGSSGSQYTYKMVAEAVEAAKAMYDIDFSDFDTDGDGKVDNVYCLYAGYGRADSGVGDSIWPHSYELSACNAEFEVDGVIIDRYTVSQQVNGQTHLPVGIGTFVHEFGHVLGFADHYNNSSSMGNPVNNVGNWDLMSNGSYNDDQNCPPTLSAFERYSLGWTTPVELNPTSDELIEMTSYMATGQCFRISVTDDDREYFLIENRQREGWDSFLPGHGILVWHIEEDQVVWDQNKPNFDQNHQMVDIIEAGGIYTSSGSPSDPFPGSMKVTAGMFNDWKNRQVFGFDWVDENEDGVCSFLLSNSGYVLPSPIMEITELMGTSATLRWEECELADSYVVSLYREGVELHSESHNQVVPVYFAGLEPETEYTVRIIAQLGTLKSEIAEYHFTTLPLQIEEKKVEVLPAGEITADSFTARWKVMPEAEDYIISLFSLTHDGEGIITHGFDNFSTSNPDFPEGWEMTDKQGRNDTDFGEAAPSVRLRDDNAYLLVTIPGEKIDCVDFWCSFNKSGLVMTVEKYADGEWSEVWRYVADRKRQFNKTLDVEDTDSLRFVLTREEGVTGGFILLDDVSLHYIYDSLNFEREINAGMSAWYNEKDNTGSLAVSGLDAQCRYAYSVKAVNGSRISLESDVIKVAESGDTGLYISESDSVSSPAVIYNIHGMRVRNDINTLPSGLYIINGKKVMVHNP